MRAKEISMLGRRYDAATLERWGLVNLVVADDALENATLAIAEELAYGPTVAHAATERLVHIAVNEGVLATDGEGATRTAHRWFRRTESGATVLFN
jgi:enoyl-CoA hydratase/carnithine racemase